MKRTLASLACALLLGVSGWAQPYASAQEAPTQEAPQAAPAPEEPAEETSPAATPSSSTDDWKAEITPTIWIPSTNLSLTYGSRSLGTVIRPEDLVGKIQFAACGHLEARKGDWGVTGDGFYVNLAEDVTYRRVNGSMRFNETLLQANGFYRLQQGEAPIDVMVGLRLYDFGISTAFSRDGLIFNQAVTFERNRSWVDPVIGMRASFPLNEDLRFGLYGDIGGFGVGSDFSYRVSGQFDYAASDSISVGVGYAALGARYRGGSGLDTFNMDLTQYGPTLALKFKI